MTGTPMTGTTNGNAGAAMQAAVQRLSAILREENTALEAMDFARAGGLLAAKHAAADALAAAWRSPDGEAPPDAAMHALGILAEENRQLLKRAMRVQQRVLDLVARAAKAAHPSNRYGANGKPSRSASAPQNFKARV